MFYPEAISESACWFAAESFARLDPKVLKPITAGQWLSEYDLIGTASNTSTPLTVLQGDPMSGGMLTDEELMILQNNCPAPINHVFFEKTGHGIHWEQPKRVIDVVRNVRD